MKELIIILLLQGFIHYKAPVGTSNISYQFYVNNPSLFVYEGKHKNINKTK